MKTNTVNQTSNLRSNAKGIAKDSAKGIAKGIAKDNAKDNAKGIAKDNAKGIAKDSAKDSGSLELFFNSLILDLYPEFIIKKFFYKWESLLYNLKLEILKNISINDLKNFSLCSRLSNKLFHRILTHVLIEKKLFTVACRIGDLKAVQKLLKDPEVKTLKQSDLFEACSKNYYKIVELLIQDGRIFPEADDIINNSPCLKIAVDKNHKKVVKCLLKCSRIGCCNYTLIWCLTQKKAAKYLNLYFCQRMRLITKLHYDSFDEYETLFFQSIEIFKIIIQNMTEYVCQHVFRMVLKIGNLDFVDVILKSPNFHNIIRRGFHRQIFCFEYFTTEIVEHLFKDERFDQNSNIQICFFLSLKFCKDIEVVNFFVNHPRFDPNNVFDDIRIDHFKNFPEEICQNIYYHPQFVPNVNYLKLVVERGFSSLLEISLKDNRFGPECYRNEILFFCWDYATMKLLLRDNRFKLENDKNNRLLDAFKHGEHEIFKLLLEDSRTKVNSKVIEKLLQKRKYKFSRLNQNRSLKVLVNSEKFVVTSNIVDIFFGMDDAQTPKAIKIFLSNHEVLKFLKKKHLSKDLIQCYVDLYKDDRQKILHLKKIIN
jgi:hypothetical protein